jgi:leucyl-tRNA synthetase
MEKVEMRSEGAFHRESGEKLVDFPAKMSKSLKNVVNPDDVISEYGADSMRLYEMFMGPLEAVKPWNTKGVEGVYRFLKRSFRMVLEQELTDEPMNSDELRILHTTIKKVTGDLESMSFNTAISQMMIFVNNFAGSGKKLNRQAAEIYVLLLAPFAPHMCEELWKRLGHDQSLAYEEWPVYNEDLLKVAQTEVLIQVKGKPKARIMMKTDLDRESMQAIAMDNEAVKEAVSGKKIVKVICVPNRLVNIVAV